MDGIWKGNQFNSSIQLNTWDLATDFDCIPHSSKRISLFKSKNGLNRSGTENCTFMRYDTILIRDFIQFSGIRYGPEFVCVYFFILFSLSLRSVSFFLSVSVWMIHWFVRIALHITLTGALIERKETEKNVNKHTSNTDTM